ncbi:DUF4397 domain-containing protein [Pedobacter hartonius]|uniref:DUF4397 domain-containing protein n=1 Tax=Pedobacter hartonius TaxID=425514 RepID=A0A1H4AQ71_9SPHI|nr:DUF4397 domain-containing protein [Pedobacter hartonius]SEA38036.1 protein of unknown function [Pedobacter hartonius]
MKLNPTLFSKKTGRSSILIAMLPAAIFFSSCSNHDDNVAVPNQAAFSVTNASPTKTPLDFYLDNQKVTTRGTLPTGSNTGYFLAVSGTRTGVVTASGSTTSLHTEKLKLETDRFHTIFIINSADTLSFLNLTDNFNNPQQGKALIRFVNLSPDSPIYSLEYEGDTTAFTNKAYKDFTAFKSVTAKTGINLNLRNTATNAIVATLPNVELKNQQIYTVWAKGLVAAAPTDTLQRIGIKITRLVQNF